MENGTRTIMNEYSYLVWRVNSTETVIGSLGHAQAMLEFGAGCHVFLLGFFYGRFQGACFDMVGLEIPTLIGSCTHFSNAITHIAPAYLSFSCLQPGRLPCYRLCHFKLRIQPTLSALRCSKVWLLLSEYSVCGSCILLSCDLSAVYSFRVYLRLPLQASLKIYDCWQSTSVYEAKHPDGPLLHHKILVHVPHN